MKPRVFFVIIGAVLIINAWLSFYHAGQAREDAQSLQALLDFRDRGARYTYDDGVGDRAERDREDLWLQAQIDDLRALVLGYEQ